MNGDMISLATVLGGFLYIVCTIFRLECMDYAEVHCTCVSNCHSIYRDVAPTSTSEVSSPVSLPDLLNHVGVKILSKWKMFGIQLEVPVSELDTYPSHNCLECYARVFASWERKGSPELSWGTVISVLESPTISERRLAVEIREKMALTTTTSSHTLL